MSSGPCNLVAKNCLTSVGFPDSWFLHDDCYVDTDFSSTRFLHVERLKFGMVVSELQVSPQITPDVESGVFVHFLSHGVLRFPAHCFWQLCSQPSVLRRTLQCVHERALSLGMHCLFLTHRSCAVLPCVDPESVSAHQKNLTRCWFYAPCMLSFFRTPQNEHVKGLRGHSSLGDRHPRRGLQLGKFGGLELGRVPLRNRW